MKGQSFIKFCESEFQYVSLCKSIQEIENAKNSIKQFNKSNTEHSNSSVSDKKSYKNLVEESVSNQINNVQIIANIVDQAEPEHFAYNPFAIREDLEYEEEENTESHVVPKKENISSRPANSSAGDHLILSSDVCGNRIGMKEESSSDNIVANQTKNISNHIVEELESYEINPLENRSLLKVEATIDEKNINLDIIEESVRSVFNYELKFNYFRFRKEIN